MLPSIEILYEDEHLVVINKPAGLVVHAGAGVKTATVVDWLRQHYAPWHDYPAGFRAGIVHRLDKDTSGALVCVKNPDCFDALSEQFKNKTNFRSYLALLHGTLAQDHCVVESYLTRDPRKRTQFISLTEEQARRRGLLDKARWARSHFYHIAQWPCGISLVSCQLETGRTHQIRVHAKSLGAPVLGDSVYTSRKGLISQRIQLGSLMGNLSDHHLGRSKVLRQMLHAQYLGFRHPVSGQQMAVCAPLPQDFYDILIKLVAYDEDKLQYLLEKSAKIIA